MPINTNTSKKNDLKPSIDQPPLHFSELLLSFCMVTPSFRSKKLNNPTFATTVKNHPASSAGFEPKFPAEPRTLRRLTQTTVKMFVEIWEENTTFWPRVSDGSYG